MLESRALNAEIIVVLDGADPVTREVINAFALDHSRIRLHAPQGRLGLWMATALGVREAAGNTIITIDDDGEYPAGAVTALIEAHACGGGKVIYGLPTIPRLSIAQRLRIRCQNLLAGQRLSSSLRIFDRTLIPRSMPLWIYVDAWFVWLLDPDQIGYIRVERAFRQARTGAWHKLYLFAQAFLCYRRSLRLAMTGAGALVILPLLGGHSTASGVAAAIGSAAFLALALRYRSIRSALRCP